MNRLILIGNGFDIAHGMKTSVKDFISDYFCNVINKFVGANKYSDDLIKLSVNHMKDRFSEPDNNFQDKAKAIEMFRLIIKKRASFSVDFTSGLLKSIFNNSNFNRWVDIELEYFRLLKEVVRSRDVKRLKTYNDNFETIKTELEKYLITLNNDNKNVKSSKHILDCFTEEIHKNEIISVMPKSIYPDNLYFLNFNYTDTLANYINDSKNRIPTEENQIHGQLDNENNPIIFGFGDEFDEEYKKFENENNNEVLKHIKSFDYLRTSNYFSLIRFIESDDYQVHIYGHSCGLSDRTMLKQIFENKHCKSIKIYYYKLSEDSNDYTEKTYAISRHFTDKSLFREKIVTFDKSRAMPQPEN